MGEPIKICIVLEGGLVQSVLTAGVPVEFVVIDYDTDGAHESELASIPQDRGGEVPAFVRQDQAEVSGGFVLQAFEIAAAHESETCQHCGEECPAGPVTSGWLCGACNGLN